MPTVVSTSFPDLLAAEEARLNRDDYPPEVTVSNEDNEEADGLLDELLNDDNDSLTNSTDDGSEETDLSELLSETPPDASKPKLLAFVSDNTSQTASEHSSENFEEALEIDSVESKSNARATSQESGMFEADTEVHHNKHDEESDDNDGSYEDEEEDDDSAASSDTHGTQDLLEKAHDRLNMQNLFEEVGRLRLRIEKKDKEMEEMAGQLRRAVATKCDLVIAHTELERHHSFNLKQLEAASRQLLKANFGLVEEQADTDVVRVSLIPWCISSISSLIQFSHQSFCPTAIDERNCASQHEVGGTKDHAHSGTR